MAPRRKRWPRTSCRPSRAGIPLPASLGEAERLSSLAGRTAGECELLLHVAAHRALTRRSASEVAEPLERAVADPRLVAAIGPGSAWLNFVLVLLLRTDRLDAMRRTLAAAAAEAQRRGAAPHLTAYAGGAWRRGSAGARSSAGPLDRGADRGS